MTASREERSYLPPEEKPDTTCGTALASFYLGIASWCLLPVLAAIPAILLGHKARLLIAKSEGRLTGDGLAVAGLVMGYVNVVFAALIIFCIASLFLLPVIEKIISA